MIKLYTAIGTCRLADNGTPVVESDGIKCLNTHELLLWTILSFHILTYQEARAEFYRMERELHILSDMDFDYYLNRLVTRRLAASGMDDVGIDALYDLLGRLYVNYLPTGFMERTGAFLKLVLCRRIPWKKALAGMKKPKLEADEKKLLSLIRRQQLSTAELVQCTEKNNYQIRSNSQLMDLIYADEASDYNTVIRDSRTTDARIPVLTALANLYFKQQVAFQIL